MRPILSFLKRFYAWGNSRTKEQTCWWLAFLAVAAIAAYTCAPIGLAYFTVLIVLMGISVCRHNRGVTLLLVGCLLLAPLPVRVQAQPNPKVQEACVPFIIGGAVVIVGGIVIYKMVKFCQKHFPPPPSSNPPPSGTNAPPSTNGASGNLRFANMTPSAEVESYDCSSTGWIDKSVPTNPVPYRDFITLRFSGSTNLLDWTNACTVNLWLSSNSMVGVVYDQNQVPVSTNRALGNPYAQSMTNRLDFPFDRSQPQLFLRDY